MELIKTLTWYSIYYVRYVNEYWIINTNVNAREAVAENLSMALARAEALDESLCKFIAEGKYGDV